MAGEIKTQEELYLQNDATFRDEGSDAWKLKGKIRSAESRGFFANIIASVFAALGGKADLIDGKVNPEQLPPAQELPSNLLTTDDVATDVSDPAQQDRLVTVGQLPDGGATINSTDDIQTEGATNLWFTEARAIAAKATANLWSYIGLGSSTSTISLKGWLDFLTNKVKLNEEQIALRVKTVNGTAPDASGNVTVSAGTGGVSSVNTKTGAVVLAASDINYSPANASFWDNLATLNIKAALDKLAGIPQIRTAFTGDTINFSAAAIQERTLTGDLVITSITGAQLNKDILLIVDSTSANYNLTLPSYCRPLNGAGFSRGIVNQIYLHCISTSGDHRFNVGYNM